MVPEFRQSFIAFKVTDKQKQMTQSGFNDLSMPAFAMWRSERKTVRFPQENFVNEDNLREWLTLASEHRLEEKAPEKKREH